LNKCYPRSRNLKKPRKRIVTLAQLISKRCSPIAFGHAV
jgi:hypothetical protein